MLLVVSGGTTVIAVEGPVDVILSDVDGAVIDGVVLRSFEEILIEEARMVIRDALVVRITADAEEVLLAVGTTPPLVGIAAVGMMVAVEVELKVELKPDVKLDTVRFRGCKLRYSWHLRRACQLHLA